MTAPAATARRIPGTRWAVLLALAWLVLSSCSGDGNGGRGGGGNTNTAGTGVVTVSLTDGPACGYSAVNVTVSKVRIHASSNASDGDAGWTDLPLVPAKRVNLLGLTNGVLETLAQTGLTAGRYTQIRLVLQPSAAGTAINSVVPVSGFEQVLDTPSAIQSGIKLVSSFTVVEGRTADIVLDFDACKSVVRRGDGTYLLKPVIRVIPLNTSGAIAGSVVPAAAAAGAIVSAQKAGVVIRSTIAETTGAFRLAPVPAADSPYDVVIAAPGFASVVVTDVPVTAATTTRVSPVGSDIVPPVSVSRSVSGTVLPADVGATVRAIQHVGFTNVEIGATNASPAGPYALSLPIAAPLLAAYSTTLPLSFAAQSAASGRHSIEASAESYPSQDDDVGLGTADAVLNFTLVRAP
ncbi:MAG: DUF4382 domain-containing protein [Burkholderiales bacterium]